MSSGVWGNEYRVTTVCVDSYADGEISGRFYNPHVPEGESFTGLAKLIVKMNDLLDDMHFPQAFTATRSFALPPQQKPDNLPDVLAAQPGDVATFAVRIILRQNTSWQGSIAWLEGQQEQSFRSVLELILLMDSALSRVKQVAP